MCRHGWGAVIVGLAVALSIPAQEPPEDAAQKAAEAWLVLVDQGKHGESWEATAKLFRSAVTKEAWQKSAAGVREPLGALVSRKLKSRQAAKTLPGAPDGDYVVIQFETSFANKRSAVETVTPMLDADGRWRVSGYYVR